MSTTHRFLFAAVIFGAFFFLTLSARSQNQLGSWNTFNFRLNTHSNWQPFAETQLRSLRFYDHFHYYEYKGGVIYKFNSQFNMGVGVGRYSTYSAGGDFVSPKQNEETRAWLQAGLKNRAGRIYFEHRYRAEQRWNASGRRNRFRYQFSLTIPLNRTELEPGAVFLKLWNELFLTNKEPFFERNRFFAGLGWESSDMLSWQAGYLRQLDYRLNDETGKSFFQISVFLQLKSGAGTADREVSPVN